MDFVFDRHFVFGLVIGIRKLRIKKNINSLQSITSFKNNAIENFINL